MTTLTQCQSRYDLATELSILKAIADHYWEFFDWPTREELVELLGPYYGMSAGTRKCKHDYVS